MSSASCSRSSSARVILPALSGGRSTRLTGSTESRRRHVVDTHAGSRGSSMMLTCAATIRQPSGNRTQVCICRPTSSGRRFAVKQRRGHRGVAAIGRDHGLCGLAHQACRRARRAKRLDRVVAVEVFADAVAQRAQIVAKQFVERGDVIAHQRRLIARERVGHFGEHIGQIDIHCQNPFGRGRDGDAGALQRIGDAQRDVFAPGGGDDLHADRHRIERDRHRHHRQPDEGYRLGVDADIGPHRQLDAVEHEVHLTEFRRHAGRRRRDDHVDGLEQLQHLGAIPAAEFLRAVHQRCRNHGAGQQPVAHRRIEIAWPLAQPIEMQRGAFAGGDDIGGGAGARGFGDFDHAAWCRAPWRRVRPLPSPRETDWSGNNRRQWRSGDRRCPAPAARSPVRAAASYRPHRRHRAPAWRHRPAPDRSTLRANGPR